MEGTARATVLALGLALGPAAVAAAQRSPAFLTVVDAAGVPLAGASVTCVFTPDDVNPWPRDVVTVTTDARGRARCDLLLRRLYVGWAIGPADEQGACLASDPLPLLASGRVVELRALDRCAPRRVRLRGHEAWREAGATGLRWLPDAREEAWLDLPLPSADEATLPPSPRTTGCLALIDDNGELLATTRVLLGSDELPAFAPPMRLEVVVTDDANAPLAGVAIEHDLPRFGGAWALLRTRLSPGGALRRAGVTSADGTLTVFAPTPAEGAEFLGQGSMLVLAHKAGYVCGASVTKDRGPVRFALATERDASIAVAGAADARIDVGAARYDLLPLPRGGTRRMLQCFPVEGTQSPWRVRTVVEGLWPRVLLSASVPTALVHDWAAPAKAQFVFDRTAMQRVEILVRDDKGGPTPCAIGLIRADEAKALCWSAVLPTDAGGRAAVCVPPGDVDWYVFATTGSAHAFAPIRAAGTAPLELKLQPFPTMRVRAVNAQGEPIANARVFGWQTSIVQGLDLGPTDVQWRNVLVEVWWSLLPRLRTDDAGEVAIPAFDQRGGGSMAVLRAGDRTCEAFDVAAGGPLEVRLQ